MLRFTDAHGRHRRGEDADLTGQHVVITGASKGVGAALASELISRGCRVTSVARTKELLREQAQQLGTNPVVQDLADPAACEGLLPRIEDEHGPIDVLVNNAAHPGNGAFTEVSAGYLREALAVNLGAPMELARQAAALMRPRGSGQIVTV
jgi:short-subunit dehydrogenase